MVHPGQCLVIGMTSLRARPTLPTKGKTTDRPRRLGALMRTFVTPKDDRP